MDRKTGAEWNAVSDRSVKEGWPGAWSWHIRGKLCAAGTKRFIGWLAVGTFDPHYELFADDDGMYLSKLYFTKVYLSIYFSKLHFSKQYFSKLHFSKL